ncbi:MAG: exosortase-associated EpsI family protein [Chloroflexi bacterium]|nr:exosortase-associated EpsI family protein [Chloroflexota bacterium]
MSRDQGRYLLVILLLAAGAVAAVAITRGGRLGAAPGGHEFAADVDNWQRTDRERAVASPYNLSLSADLTQVPLTLGAWTGVDVPQTNLEVFILLEPEQYVQRLYRLPDGRFVWLSLIGSRKSKSFHSPQICYDTDGWQTDASSESVSLAAGELYALRMVATKSFPAGGSAEHVVLYFYLWPSYSRNPQDGMVLVKVTAPMYDSLESTLALEKDFLRTLFTAAR